MTDPALATAASLQQKLEAERQRVAQLEAFTRRLLDREDLRWAVSDEVAHVALQLLRKTTGANPAQEERGLVRDALKR